jgi:hypothetical protein
MPIIEPNSIGSANPDTITATFNIAGVGVSGIVRAVSFDLTRQTQPIFGLDRRAVLLSLPALGQGQFMQILLPASDANEYNAAISAIEAGFQRGNPCGGSGSVSVSFSCNGSSITINFENAFIVQSSGYIDSSNFVFIQEMRFAFANYGA